MRIEDDVGNSWIVRKGQPGHEAVKKLEKSGFRYIVLPVEMLTGKENVVDWPEILHPNDTAIHRQRLRDCIAVVEGKVSLG